MLFLYGNEKQFDVVLKDLTAFGAASGLVVNYEKSKAFYLGSLRRSIKKILTDGGLVWLRDNECLKYLGIKIPIGKNVDTNNMLNLNFENTLNLINTILNIWKTRGLTLIDKVTIIKALISPKLIYKIIVPPISIPFSH